METVRKRTADASQGGRVHGVILCSVLRGVYMAHVQYRSPVIVIRTGKDRGVIKQKQELDVFTARLDTLGIASASAHFTHPIIVFTFAILLTPSLF